MPMDDERHNPHDLAGTHSWTMIMTVSMTRYDHNENDGYCRRRTQLAP